MRMYHENNSSTDNHILRMLMCFVNPLLSLLVRDLNRLVNYYESRATEEVHPA